MKRSFIREILEHTTSETISFAGGLPDAKLFPNILLAKSAKNVLSNVNSLQYSTSTGFGALKEQIAKMYCDEGFETTAKNIMITSGSQQALDIIARYNHGKKITIESPSYLGAMNIFDMNGLQQDCVKLNKDGIDIDAFEESFKNSKLSYLIPDFQNPTGYRYSENKRKQIAKMVLENDGVLIEDAPYSQIYFDKKFDSISVNIPKNSYHLGSFSKTLAPAFRIGWIRADEELLEPLIAYKEAMDLHTNSLGQQMISDYLKNTKEYESHLDTIRTSYKKKMQVFCCYLDEILPQFEYSKPKGGMFIYGRLPNINTSQLVEKCIEQGVAFVPGSEFYRENKSLDEIRFNFTNSSSKQILVGLRIILQILKELK